MKIASKSLSILIILAFLLGGMNIRPVQAHQAANPSGNTSLPDGLSQADWTQIKALLPQAAVLAPNSQEAYLKASNTDMVDSFGYSIAISGDTIVVGAYGEASNATGVNGDQSDNSAGNAGAAYVFIRNGGNWSQQAYLKASNTDMVDSFGYSVAISGDTIVVGAPYEDSNTTGVNGDQSDNSANAAGAAYVFTRSGGVWSQQAYLKASNTDAGDQFGAAVSISGDIVVVAAEGETSNAIGVGGDQGNNSAILAGAAYVFTRSGTIWSQQAYLKASNTEAYDHFGASVAISGETLVVGASAEDSNATGVDGNQGNNTAGNAGAAYVFTRSGTTWSQQAYLKASNTGDQDYFGESVAISNETLVVGAWGESSNTTGVNGNQGDNSATNAGAAYVFTRNSATWSQQAYLKASNTDLWDEFGYSVAISDDTIVVGAYYEDSNATGLNGNQSDNSANDAGAAYVFTRNGGTWSQGAYLKASNTNADDEFGWSVTISDDTIMVGAPSESSNATGVNGNQNDNSAAEAGAAYVFAASSDITPPEVVSITRNDPTPTSKRFVSYTVTFTEVVTGVDHNDFTLSTAITSAYVYGVGGTGDTRTVTVYTGTGNGTIQLNLRSSGTDIQDLAGNPINGGFYNGEIYTVSKQLTLRSVGTYDGWLLEKTETSNIGGTLNNTATTLRLGDDAARKQYRSILSFSTQGLPDNAVITKVTFKVRKQSISGGGNPVTIFQGFMVDIKRGLFGTSTLQLTDFQAPANKTYGPFNTALIGGWYTINLTSGKAYINKLSTNSGLTQIRLRFKLDDNNNAIANYLSLYSGNAGIASRPQLIIEYYTP